MTFQRHGKLCLKRLLTSTPLTSQTRPDLEWLTIAVEVRTGQPERLKLNIHHFGLWMVGACAQHPALRTLLPEHGTVVQSDDRCRGSIRL